MKELNRPDTQRQDNDISRRSSAESWHKAVEAEQRKRLVAVCFLLDVQRALLFSHSPNLAISDLQISLPCRTLAWEAGSAEEWQTHCTDEQNAPTLLAVVESYMTRSLFSRARELDLFTYMVVLHGLMSMSDHTHKRNRMSCSEGPDETKSWRSNMSLAYDIWNADFDVFCSNSTGNVRYMPNTDRPSPECDLEAFKSSAVALYHTANMMLNVDITALQTYAGVPRIAGQQVQELDRKRARCEMQAWALGEGSSSSANKAIRHAAHILQQCLPSSHDSKVRLCLQQPWCLYLAALTCWAFADVRSSMDAAEGGAEPALQRGRDSTLRDANEFTARSEMIAITSLIISRGPDMLAGISDVYPIGGLLTTVSQHLLSLGSDSGKECSRTLERLLSR